MRRVVCNGSILLVFGLVLSGCELSRGTKPSVLVIAVEGLGREALSCDTDSATPFALCEESVRFSHAFAPSTMAQATIASLLTGLYPLDHGVRHNGNQFLSARFKTLAEGALKQNYRTAFFSGGPPIWRKSGLAQGFEVFDDQVELSLGTYYRPVDEVFRLFQRWTEHETNGQPFVGVCYLADLQFPQTPTRNNEGELREKSPAGQLEEITESIGNLVKWLKARKRWNNTHVVLVGLNSLTATEPTPLSLKSSSVQVSLFIKPARKERDNVIQWAIDRNVSVVDVAATLFELLGLEAPTHSIAELGSQSLVSVLNTPEPNWDEDRLVLSETGWPEWIENSGIRWSVRQNQFLYIHDQKPMIFNTLTDRNETLPLKQNDPLWMSLNSEVLELVAKPSFIKFSKMPWRALESLEIAREVWVDNAPMRPLGGDEPWLGWYLQHSVDARDWRSVKHMSQTRADPIGTFIAARHLGEIVPVPRNPCLRLILGEKGNRAECGDDKILALTNWRGARNEDARGSAQEHFNRVFNFYAMDQEIGRLNYLNGLRWDVRRDLPEPPQLIDYVLTLKEFKSLAR